MQVRVLLGVPKKGFNMNKKRIICEKCFKKRHNKFVKYPLFLQSIPIGICQNCKEIDRLYIEESVLSLIKS